MVALSFALLRSCKVLSGYEFTGAFAVFDDAADAEWSVHYLDGVADLNVLGFGKKIVDDHVIRPLERPALQVTESDLTGPHNSAGRSRR